MKPRRNDDPDNIVPTISFLAFAYSFGSLGTGLTLPILPLYIVSLGASLTDLGIILSLINLASAAVRLPVGILSDRYGYKRFLFMGLLFCAVAQLLTILASVWQQLVVAMLLAGLSTGLYYPTQNSIVTRYTSPSHRAMAFGTVFASMGIGSVIGPVIGGVVSEKLDPRTTFMLALAAISATIPIALRMGMTRKEKVLGRTWTRRELVTMIRRGGRPLALLSLARLTHAMSFQMAPPLIPIYLKTILHASETYIGLILTIAGIASVTGTWMGGLLSRRIGYRRIITVGLLAEIPCYVAILFVSDLVQATVLIAVYNLVSGYAVALDAITGDFSTPETIGLTFGFTGTFLRVGMMAGNIVGGAAADLYGLAVPFYLSSASLVGTIVLVLAFPKGERGVDAEAATCREPNPPAPPLTRVRYPH